MIHDGTGNSKQGYTRRQLSLDTLADNLSPLPGEAFEAFEHLREHII